MRGATHGVALPGTSGAMAAPYDGPVRVYGLTVENANTAGGATVIVRDGSSSGRIVISGSAVAQSGSIPGVDDVGLSHGRVVNNGVYVEIDGTSVTGTLWVG